MLLYATAVGASFSAMSVINFIGSEDVGSGLAFSWLLMMMVTSGFIYDIFRKSKKKINQPANLSLLKYIGIYWIFVFAGIVNLGLNENVAEAIATELVIKSPGLDISNLVRFSFLTLGILFVCLFSLKAKKACAEDMLIMYLHGSLAACMIGLFDYFIFHGFMAEIFNTSISKYAQGFTAEGKISGPAVEPSIFIQCLGIALSIQISLLASKTSYILKNKIAGCLSILLMLITIIFSGSHTALPVLCALAIQVLILTKSPLRRIFIVLIFIALAMPFIISAQEKLTSFSALERAESIFISFNLFLYRPLLGYGFAEVTSHDLIVNSLANTGIIATILFVIVFAKIIKNNIYYRNIERDNFINNASMGTALNLLFSNFFTGFAHPFVHLYLVLAIGVWSYSRLNIYSSKLSK
jgi:cbb3-type cytochrome oxidase subunit 3